MSWSRWNWNICRVRTSMIVSSRVFRIVSGYWNRITVKTWSEKVCRLSPMISWRMIIVIWRRSMMVYRWLIWSASRNLGLLSRRLLNLIVSIGSNRWWLIGSIRIWIIIRKISYSWSWSWGRSRKGLRILVLARLIVYNRILKKNKSG